MRLNTNIETSMQCVNTDNGSKNCNWNKNKYYLSYFTIGLSIFIVHGKNANNKNNLRVPKRFKYENITKLK